MKRRTRGSEMRKTGDMEGKIEVKGGRKGRLQTERED